MECIFRTWESAIVKLLFVKAPIGTLTQDASSLARYRSSAAWSQHISVPKPACLTSLELRISRLSPDLEFASLDEVGSRLGVPRAEEVVCEESRQALAIPRQASILGRAANLLQVLQSRPTPLGIGRL